jgi:cytochrome c
MNRARRPGFMAAALSAGALLSIVLILRTSASEPEPVGERTIPRTAVKPCDAKLGESVFAQCAICHSTEKDVAPVAGPNLHGIVGRVAGSAPGFAYSPALRGSRIRWTPGELDRFLEDPMATVPGTSMAFAGLKQPEQRAAVICYLQQTAR